MTQNLSEPRQFKAGETYRTRGGYEAVPLEVGFGPGTAMFGRVYINGNWQPAEWYFDGQNKFDRARDLLPPKRQVWMILAKNISGQLYSRIVFSKKDAESYKTRIAVAGPFDVEPAP